MELWRKVDLSVDAETTRTSILQVVYLAFFFYQLVNFLAAIAVAQTGNPQLPCLCRFLHQQFGYRFTHLQAILLLYNISVYIV